MAAQRLLYSGTLDLGDIRAHADLWASASTAITFGEHRRVLSGIGIGLTDDRRLRITGSDEQGQLVEWQGTEAARVETRWHNAEVAWPDGITWEQAQVSATQYGVHVTANGRTVDLPAARVAAVGSQRWIVDGEQWIAASSARCVPCTGSRAR